MFSGEKAALSKAKKNPMNEAIPPQGALRPRITDRIDAITRIPPASRSPTPPIPRSVKIELTARCDFNCFFCATAKKLRHKADMDEAFYRRIVREIRGAGVEELGVF